MSRGQPQSRRATATRTPHPPSPQKYPTPTQKKPVTDLQHNAANRVDTAHAHEYTKGKMLELAGFMKHLHDGIPIRRHLENGREDKICIRGSGEAGDDGVAWDGLCCSKARTSFTWEELKEVRTYSRATIGKTVHPTATLAKSPMPSGAKAADVDLTFSLILEDGWSLDLTCNSAPGHHLAVRGFELARKHHMQEGHKGHNPRQGKKKEASGMAKATAALHNAHLLYAETQHSSHGSGSRIVVGATVEVAYAHSIEPAHAVFDPHQVDAQGRPVRDYPFRVKIPRGYMRFPTRAWHEGQYVIGVVSAYDKATKLYTVDYKSGPYHQTDGPHLNPSVKGLPDATVIEKVHREHLCVEEAVSSTDNFPFLMILVSLAQVICFAYWAPKRAAANGQEITATTPVAGPQYLWFKTVRNWPYCNDRRQFWYMTLSYQLVHSGLEHIMFNIVLQLIFGIPIELVHGAIVFFIYEVGVIMGALACALSDPYIAVVGCSGGVYCLFGIHVAHMMLNWKDMKHSAVPREMRVLVFGMLFGSEVVAWWCLNTAGKSFAAHAGGALAGFLMGVGFMTNFEIEEWEVYMRWFCRFCFAFFVVLGVIWYVVKDPPAPLSMWGYGDKNKIPCCFQMFDCDIERSYKYYHVFDCHRVLEDDKNSYQYRLKSKDPASVYDNMKNPFQQCNDVRAEIVSACASGFMKQVTGSSCADDRNLYADNSEFTTGDIGPYKHYFSSNE